MSDEQAPLDGYDDLTAEQILELLSESTPETVEAVKAYERTQQRPRRTILNYEPPAPEPPDLTERYDAAGWKERARRLGANKHAVAGALHDLGDKAIDEAEARQRVDEFIGREIS